MPISLSMSIACCGPPFYLCLACGPLSVSHFLSPAYGAAAVERPFAADRLDRPSLISSFYDLIWKDIKADLRLEKRR